MTNYHGEDIPTLAYINFSFHQLRSPHERRSFLRRWWRIYASDPHNAPPPYDRLKRELDPGYNAHLARLKPQFFLVEALPRRTVQPQVKTSSWLEFRSLEYSTFDQEVAAAIVLTDPRRADQRAYLGLFRTVNDPETFNRFLEHLSAELSTRGIQQLIGPTGISPHLDSGVLMDYFNRIAPQHTAYNPPYLPELFIARMQPLEANRLYEIDTLLRSELSLGRHQIVSFDPSRLVPELYDLFSSTFTSTGLYPIPDHLEASYLLNRVAHPQWRGWLALSATGLPAGYVVIAPDLSKRLRIARGGRSLLQRVWLLLTISRPVQQGRILFGGVLPEARRQGIGTQLLSTALQHAIESRWERLTLGPFNPGEPVAAFLTTLGAIPRQSYHHFSLDLS